jgi:uncharacterized membrane protein YqjE
VAPDVASSFTHERPAEPASEIDAVERMVDAAQRLVTERIELARLDVQDAMATTLWRTLGMGFILLLQLTGWWTLIAAAVLELDDRLPLAASLGLVGVLHIVVGGALFLALRHATSKTGKDA